MKLSQNIGASVTVPTPNTGRPNVYGQQKIARKDAMQKTTYQKLDRRLK